MAQRGSGAGADEVPFGKYRLIRRLARGGMGEVFLAREMVGEGVERMIALKRILPELSANRQFVVSGARTPFFRPAA